MGTKSGMSARAKPTHRWLLALSDLRWVEWLAQSVGVVSSVGFQRGPSEGGEPLLQQRDEWRSAAQRSAGRRDEAAGVDQGGEGEGGGTSATPIHSQRSAQHAIDNDRSLDDRWEGSGTGGKMGRARNNTHATTTGHAAHGETTADATA